MEGATCIILPLGANDVVTPLVKSYALPLHHHATLKYNCVTHQLEYVTILKRSHDVTYKVFVGVWQTVLQQAEQHFTVNL